MSRPVLTVEALADWLRTQPGETTYDWTCQQDCVLCRYFSGVGQPFAAVYSTGWRDLNGDLHRWGNIPLNFIAEGPHGARQWTYAAALERAEAILTAGKAS